MATIHLVSHTHWDREWYLTFQQFRLKLVHLVDRLLNILESDPDYKYFLLDGQAIILEDYLAIRPEREADLIRHIKSGRLLIGPWYISPDEFLISPESHIRNLLEGDRICQVFGAKMRVGYLPDTFGHIGQMPQILKGFGIDTACLWRGLDDQPVELTWKSTDGTAVLLSYLRESYGNAANLPDHEPERFIKEIGEISRSLTPFSLTGELLLMNGTDHMEPSEELTASLSAYHASSLPTSLIHSSLPLYFASVQQQISEKNIVLPFVSGELRSPKHSPLLRDVLSTHITLKQRNHACETALLKWVEPLSAWAQFLDLTVQQEKPIYANKYPAYLADNNAVIRHAWKILMQCHPHDSICGTSIDQVIDELKVRFEQVDQISNELIDQNLQRISDHIDTTFPASNISNSNQFILSPIIVFNPTDLSQSGLVDIKVRLDNHNASFDIIDDQNNSYAYWKKGLGTSELFSMILDKKGLKQGLGMIHEGNIAGMVIRDFDIAPSEQKAVIRVTLSDHSHVDLAKWQQAMKDLDTLLSDPRMNEFHVTAYSDPEIELSFVAKDVPAHGYRCYWMRGVGNMQPKSPRKINPIYQRLLPIMTILTRIPFASKLLQPRQHDPARRMPKIENEYFVLEASSTDGTLTITDKLNHQTYSGQNRFIDGADSGDVYNYSPPAKDFIISATRVSLERQVNPTCQKLVICYRLQLPHSLSADRKSRSRKRVTHYITSTISLIQGVPRVDIHTELENQALDHRLKVHFPAPFSCSSAFYDGHFELVERPIDLPPYDASWEEQPRRESPQQKFTLVTNGKSSLTIAASGLPEVEVFHNEKGDAEIAVTLLRCIGWLSRDDLTTRKGHAGPMGVSTPQAQMPGKHAFDYAIIPGGMDLLAPIHQAYAFTAPMKAITSTVHQGSLPSTSQLIENSNPSFIISAIKLSENGSGLIVRGYNLVADPIEIRLKPHKIFKHAQFVDLKEEHISPVQMIAQGEVRLLLPGKKIATILFTH